MQSITHRHSHKYFVKCKQVGWDFRMFALNVNYLILYGFNCSTVLNLTINHIDLPSV